MAAEILAFTGLTILPDDPKAALEKAKGWGMEKVVIVGLDRRGMLVFGGTHSTAGEALLLLEIAKKRVMETVEGQFGQG